MKRLLTAALLVLASNPLLAEPLNEYQSRWAEIKYQLSGSRQEKAFEDLNDDIHRELTMQPDDAGYLIWSAIIGSSYAGARGGLGALKYVKAARNELEKAIEIDASALDGSAYTSLGSLYYQVPGWPVAFGSDKKAEEMLQKALALNPDGIDPNYFYGDFLVRQKRYDEAIKYLDKALQAPDRPGRSLADRGRRDEVRQLLEQARLELGDAN
ncbi:MAG: tetratricopeptide repeat protein [Oceanospirillaceae bacterium]|nr:tetratricopeptide repeat protein [Oceanospirillaceae bacterium]